MRAFQRAGQIHIEIQDDGAGLNAQKIKTKAIENKLKTSEELKGMSTKEIYQLIMLPGFSTAEAITNTSGRGVGMDVVRQRIEEHNGSLEIDSDPGKGTRFTIKLPLTMAIIPSLIVEAGQERFAIPQVNLQEVIQFYDEDALEAFEKVGNSQVCRIRHHVYPLVHLRDLLQLQSSDNSASTGTCVLLLKLGKDNFCMTVDKVCTTEEIVIKPMYSLLKSLPFYSGATVMGDGDVALILDIPSIAKCLQLNLGEKVVTEESDENADTRSIDTSSYLFFENSSTECFGLPLDSIQRIEKISSSKIQTVGNRQLTSIQDQNFHVLQLCEIYDVSPCNQREELILILPKYSSSPLGILASKRRYAVQTNGFLANLKMNQKVGVVAGLFLIALGASLYLSWQTLMNQESRAMQEIYLLEQVMESKNRAVSVQNLQEIATPRIDNKGKQIWGLESNPEVLALLSEYKDKLEKASEAEKASLTKEFKVPLKNLPVSQ